MGVGVHVPLGGLLGRVRTTGTGGDPMDRHGIQGHVEGAGEQTEDRVFKTTEVDEGKDVAGTQDQGNDGTDQGTLGHLTELHLGGTLENGGGGHQGADEENGQPARDEDIVQDENDRGQGLQTNVALVLIVQDGDAVEDHQDQDHGVGGQEYNVDLV